MRYYGAQRLVRPIEVRGTATRYGRRDLMLLLGISRLRTDDDSTLAEKKQKLEALGQADLEQWLRAGPLPEAAAKALGFEPVPAATSAPPSPAKGSLEIGNANVEYWQLIALLPGLDLMLRAEARDAARAAAKRICEEYVVRLPLMGGV